MVRSSDIILISSSQTLSLATDIYLINANNSGFTITLPLISCNGINYRLIREDINSNIVNIRPTNPNLFIWNLGPNGSTNNLNIAIGNVISIESYNNNWYIINNSSIPKTIGTIFSSLFRTNNGTPFISSNTTSRKSIGTFTYTGSSPISQIIFTIAPSSTALTTGTLDIQNLSNNSSLIASGSYSLTNKTITNLVITTIVNLPSTISIFDIGITTNGKIINIYSIIVQ